MHFAFTVFNQYTEQPLSNSEPWKSWKYKQKHFYKEFSDAWCDCDLLYNFGCGKFWYVNDAYFCWFLFTANKAYLN